MSLINIKQIDNTSAGPDSVIAFDGTKNVWMRIRHHQAIMYAELVNGKITIQHELGRKYVQVSLYDENDQMVMPDEIKLVDSNSLEIDLTSFGQRVTTWNVAVA